MTTVDTTKSDMSPEDKRKLIAQLLRQKLRESRTVYTPSPAQQGVWFMQQMNRATTVYNIPFCVRVLSLIDCDHLKAALQSLMDRHALLRSTFRSDGIDIQVIVHGCMDAVFTQVDSSSWSEQELIDQVNLSLNAPFDLQAGPLVRMHLFSRTKTDHVLLLAVHHLVCDGWSLGIVVNELMNFYENECAGRPSSLAPVAAEYSDYVRDQQAFLAGPEGAANREYWEGRLRGEIPRLDLPVTQPRTTSSEMRSAVQHFQIDNRLYRRLKNLAASNGMTLFAVLLAAYQALLMRLSRQNEVLVGVPLAGRTQAEYEGTVGHFVNLVVLRAAVEGNCTFQEFLRTVWNDFQQAIEHQAFPFSELVRRLRPSSRSERAPIIQTSLNVLRILPGNPLTCIFDKEAVPMPWGPLQVAHFPLTQLEEHYDLSIRFIDVDGRLDGTIQYDVDLFEPALIEHYARCLVTLLESAAGAPETPLFNLPILDAADRQEILVSWNATGTPYPANRPLHRLIEEQAARTATAVAVVSGDFCLTYGQLNQRANRLAHYLKECGVNAEDPVAICMKRSPDLAVAMLATLKAGGVYVPIDPTYPSERVNYMLADCRARIVLTHATENLAVDTEISNVFCMDRDWEQVATREASDLTCDVHGQNLAYIIYTSGSTGAPKGTEITHSALVNFLYSMQRQPGLGASDILFSVTSPSFDIFGLELWLPLLFGARVVLASPEEVVDGVQLCKALAQSQATVMQATPATWRMLLAAGAPLDRSLKALCGGESLPADLAEELISRGIELWNMYGPTETTVWSTVEPIKNTRDRITIGRPIANTAAYVLDAALQPVPVGVTGELFLAGAGVARGYFRRPDLTAEKFLSDPFGTFPEGRMYRTGDLARFLPDGRIECLGRTDHQIKIRGYRIEPGEIEARLATHPQIGQAIVVLRQDRAQDQRLIAYIVASDGQPVPATLELQRFLRERLPDYMIPSTFVALPSLPLTPNGKVDRKSLPAPHQTESLAVVNSSQALNHCFTPQESILMDLWKELLDVPSILPTDDFFALGGHSLLAARMFSRLEHQYRRPLPVALLFRSPTIRTLAREIDNYPPTVEGPKIFTFRANGHKPPLILMPSLDGAVLMWRDLVLQLPNDRPVGGVYLAGDSMFAENMRMQGLAKLCAQEIAEHYPHGPCHLAGYSFGGMLAFEVATQLKAMGREVGTLTVMDIGPERMHVGSALEVLCHSGQIATNIVIRSWDALRNESWGKLVGLVFRRLSLLGRYWFTRKDNPTSDYDMAYEYLFAGVDLPERLHQRITVNLRRGIGYTPGKYDGDILLLRSTKRSMFGPFRKDLGWGEHIAGTVRVVALQGAHNDVIDLQQVQTVASILTDAFAHYDGENTVAQPPPTARSMPGATVRRKAR